jgi:hypothetical protein
VETSARGSIGVLTEKPLHDALKRAYALPDDRIEAPVGRYIVDILRGELVIEIQTGHFAPLRRKVAALLEDHDVLLVAPVPVRKTIIRLSADGGSVTTRRSPKRGAVVDVFAELVSFPHLVGHPRFALEVALTSEEEVRRPDARRGWRRHGWVVDHRRLIEIVDRVRVTDATDLRALLPADLAEPFTTSDLARSLGRPRMLAQRMAYCLAKAGAIVPVGRTGEGVRYMVAR